MSCFVGHPVKSNPFFLSHIELENIFVFSKMQKKLCNSLFDPDYFKLKHRRFHD